MSTQTLNLEGNPFSQQSDNLRPPQSTYRRVLSDIHTQLLKRKKIIFLEGTAGSGRTTLLQNLISSFDRKTHHVYLHAYELTEFTCEPDSDQSVETSDQLQTLTLIKEFILAQSSLGSHVVLIIDDVARLSDEVIMCIDDMLSSKSRNSRNITVIFAGEPASLANLQHEYSTVLKQHSMAYTRLSNLTVSDIQQYIAEHLEALGKVGNLEFSFQLCEVVHNFTRGDLQKTHQLLHEVFAVFGDNNREAYTITESDMQEAAERLDLGISPDRQAASLGITVPAPEHFPESSYEINDDILSPDTEDADIEVTDTEDKVYSDPDKSDATRMPAYTDFQKVNAKSVLVQDFMEMDAYATSSTAESNAPVTDTDAQVTQSETTDVESRDLYEPDKVFNVNNVLMGDREEKHNSGLIDYARQSERYQSRNRRFMPATAFFVVGLLFGVLVVALLTDIPKVLFRDEAALVTSVAPATDEADNQTIVDIDSNEAVGERETVSELVPDSDETEVLDANNSDTNGKSVIEEQSPGPQTILSDNTDVDKVSEDKEPAEFSTLSESDSSPDIETSDVAIVPEVRSQNNQSVLKELFDKAEIQYQAKKLTTPKGDSAYDTYAEILIMDPGNQQALDGIQRLKDRYIQWADHAANNGNDRHAHYLYNKALSLDPDDAELAAFIVRFDEQRGNLPDKLSVSAQSADQDVTPQKIVNKLFDAIKISDIKTVDMMLENHQLINVRQNASGFTPLIYAAIHGQRSMIKLLLDKNANIDLSDNLGNTALMWAIEKEWFDASSYLIQRGADIESENQAGGTALHYAAWDGNVSMVQLLLSKNANINRKNVNGTTPLIQAVINGHTDVVKTLLKNNADANLVNENGWTALMYAASGGRKAIAVSLLAADANTEIENNNGLKATDIARMLGHNDIVTLLNDTVAVNSG